MNFLGGIEGDEPRKKLKERIKPLWKSLYEILTDKQKQHEFQRIIASLYVWLGTVEEIDDDVKEWMTLTAKYIRAQYHESGLIEELEKHVNKTPANVGDIYINTTDGCAYMCINSIDYVKQLKIAHILDDEKEIKRIKKELKNNPNGVWIQITGASL